MASENLKKFLKELAQNPQKQREYVSDPKKVMDEFGVEQEHQEMILNGDTASLGKAIGGTDACPILLIHNYKR